MYYRSSSKLCLNDVLYKAPHKDLNFSFYTILLINLNADTCHSKSLAVPLFH